MLQTLTTPVMGYHATGFSVSGQSHHNYVYIRKYMEVHQSLSLNQAIKPWQMQQCMILWANILLSTNFAILSDVNTQISLGGFRSSKRRTTTNHNIQQQHHHQAPPLNHHWTIILSKWTEVNHHWTTTNSCFFAPKYLPRGATASKGAPRTPSATPEAFKQPRHGMAMASWPHGHILGQQLEPQICKVFNSGDQRRRWVFYGLQPGYLRCKDERIQLLFSQCGVQRPVGYTIDE